MIQILRENQQIIARKAGVNEICDQTVRDVLSVHHYHIIHVFKAPVVLFIMKVK